MDEINFSTMTFEELCQAYRKYFNQFVILDTEIYKFVGFGEDDHDYYYIGAPATAYSRSADGLFRISAVCWFEPLKGKLSDRYYDMLKYRWNLNKGPRPHAFLIEPVAKR